MRPRPFTGKRFRLAAGLLSAGLLSAGLLAQGPGAGAAAASATAAPQLHVSGHELADASGQQVVLHGVDRSGGEYMCVGGHGVWDGQMNQASVTAMKSWNVNAVRVPLNEACWNGESYVDWSWRGARYQNQVKKYVALLDANGITPILDLHWTDGQYAGAGAGCSATRATCQKPMPDIGQSIRFWASVAQTFKGNNSVIFDLFNEPYPEQASGETPAGSWNCWEHGGRCPGISYLVAGMQPLVNAIRSAGASNVLMLGGLAWSNDLTGWLAHEPRDPDHNLVASWHSYNFNRCDTTACWNSQIAPVLAKVPVIAGEIGENDCAAGYVNNLTSWMNAHGGSYLAWAWNADFSCSAGPGLITSYDGTPTAYGAGYKADIAPSRSSRATTR
jgi:endoglucanase